ncbi:glycoside hydrolase family 2 TIM barrel-domain containing protein [Prevotella sp. Sow4_E9_plate]|uniref:glycoside hydrolase family 2 TIM barrel-domain containing protein n=1 Tax=Prevotella sp. Sow4_E9_plate TaxID=3438802 RepID=UPI003F9ADCED
MIKRSITFMTLALVLTTLCQAQSRKVINLPSWDFSRDGKAWQQVAVPHDWAIAGPFDKKWDLQMVAIEQNGEKEKTEKSGRSGALPWIGEGMYKMNLQLPKGYKRAVLVFDGAMSQPIVKVNGKEAGRWAYGYNAFRIDITPYVQFGGKKNLVEVHLNNVEESSRWYPGGGLYRPVSVELYGNENFSTWDTFVRTLKADKQEAEVEVNALLEGKIGKSGKTVIALLDEAGTKVAEQTISGATPAIKTTLKVANPQLWSPESPYLYQVKLTRYEGKKVADVQTLKTGIRTISVSKNNGFQLNGITRKIKGVCLHHDLGPLGAAENKAALIRQIKTMKEMGCDAIRTAHNMPSTMQMEICDSLGMMVMAESFDMWIYPKCKNGYAKFFKEWSDRDMTNLVKHHRNHPSIIMWSIGNEIPEQWSKEGMEIAKHLQDICHQYDPSRPVTQGMDKAEAALKSGFAQVMDVPGFNYRVHKYYKNIEQLPQGFLLGSETASTVSSRGVYKFPVEVRASNNNPYADGQCSSYDTEYCSWSNLPDDDWKMQDDHSWVIGEFVWTGYDYLGEPTPYDTYWPSRSSYFGICDLAGLPKDRYYMYRARWNEHQHTTHLLPHWNWQGREGQVTPVYCYTDGVEGELFVNGKSQGRVRKDKSSRLDRYRLRWNNVKYEPGEIRVVTYNQYGDKVGEDVKRTAGEPAQMKFSVETPDHEPIACMVEGCTDEHNVLLNADGKDLAFVTVSLLDKDGNECPLADDELTFEVTGAGTFKAACNGDATSLEPFTHPHMKLFSGKLVVIVQSSTQKGNITLKVKDGKRNIEKTIQLEAI